MLSCAKNIRHNTTHNLRYSNRSANHLSTHSSHSFADRSGFLIVIRSTSSCSGWDASLQRVNYTITDITIDSVVHKKHRLHLVNKKAQLSLTNPHDANRCQKVLQFDVETSYGQLPLNERDNYF